MVGEMSLLAKTRNNLQKEEQLFKNKQQKWK